MRASELCVRDVVTADENESVVEAAQRMAQLAVGDLIVVKERPQGQPHPIPAVRVHCSAVVAGITEHEFLEIAHAARIRGPIAQAMRAESR